MVEDTTMKELQNPVIVIPGITGTSLYDEYPLKPDALWTAVLNKEYGRLALHPEDLRYEASEPAVVRARALLGMAYDDLLEALRYDLTSRPDQPTPVFAFPYDWRQDVRETGAQLAAFVTEAIARTKLLRHYRGYERSPKVDLVAHSMGGLVICEYLAQFPAQHSVGKIVTLGTPYLGSIEALVKLLTGLGNISGAVPKAREREAARSMPAIYQLLPSFRGAVKAISTPAPVTDLFNVAAWQPGVLESLAEYIRQHAVEPGNQKTRAIRARELLKDLLTKARRHRRRVNGLNLGAVGLSASDWLAIVGIGARTRVRAEVALDAGQPRFQLTEKDWVNDPKSGATGDSTVPFSGALPPFIPKESVVAVTPDDFGFWELRDRVLGSQAGFHAMLPNLNLAQRLALKHLRGKRYRGPVAGRPGPGVDPEHWSPPIPGLEPREES